jgi:hypothetical protein
VKSFYERENLIFTDMLQDIPLSRGRFRLGITTAARFHPAHGRQRTCIAGIDRTITRIVQALMAMRSKGWSQLASRMCQIIEMQINAASFTPR